MAVDKPIDLTGVIEFVDAPLIEGKSFRDVLKIIVEDLWRLGEGFTNERPSGNKNWQRLIIEAVNESIPVIDESQPISDVDSLGDLVNWDIVDDFIGLAIRYVMTPRGSTPSEAVDRYEPRLDVRVEWHVNPEDVYRKMWEPVAFEEGMTWREFCDGAHGGEDEDGEPIEMTYIEMIDTIRKNRCWGFADTSTSTIHAWAVPDIEEEILVHFLAHEIGHLSGVSEEDDIAEEYRAEMIGQIARRAVELARSR